MAHRLGFPITFAGAVFAVGVAVGGERFAADGTSKMIYRFPVDFIGMFFPPCHTTTITTETTGWLYSFFHELFALITALFSFIFFATDTISLAVGFYGVHTKTESFGYICVGQAFTPHEGYFFFL